MSIDKLTRKHREGDKDVYYTLVLSEYRFLNIPAVKMASQQQSDTNGLNNRPNTQTAPKSCTVVAGDCLWNIAKKYYATAPSTRKSMRPTRGQSGATPT